MLYVRLENKWIVIKYRQLNWSNSSMSVPWYAQEMDDLLHLLQFRKKTDQQNKLKHKKGYVYSNFWSETVETTMDNANYISFGIH